MNNEKKNKSKIHDSIIHDFLKRKKQMKKYEIEILALTRRTSIISFCRYCKLLHEIG